MRYYAHDSHRVFICISTVFSLASALWLASVVGGQTVTATWVDNANGQLVADCNPSEPGGEFFWPDNNLWSQDLFLGNHPCTGVPGFTREPSNWSTDFFPNNGSGGFNYDVVIGAPAPTQLDVNVTIETLTVGAAGELQILGGRSLSIANGLLSNDGTVTVNSNNGGATTGLAFTNDTMLEGTGEVVLNRFTTNSQLTTGVGATLTQAADHAIRGSGRVSAALVNNGLVEATIQAGGFTLELMTEDKTNNNIFRANANTELHMNGITVTQDDSTGQIIADGGLVGIFNAAQIVNGVLTTPNDGVFQTTNSATLTDVTNHGTYNLISGSTVTVNGTGITNNGTITVNSNNGGATTTLLFDGDGMLEGTGEIILNRFTTNSQLSTAEGTTITQAATHAIRGSGRVHAALVNNGLVEATIQAGGFTLELMTEDKTNNSIFRAIADTELHINGITVTQDAATGQIISDGGLVSIFNGATVVGGDLISENGGVFQTTNSATLTDVTNEGTYNLISGATVTVNGTGITNNGTITVNSNNAGATTTLLFDGDGMLEGTGEIVLNRFTTNSQLRTVVGATLTQAADHSIRGSGTLAAELINNGVVEATVQPTASTLVLTTEDKTNNSIFRANANTELHIDGITVTQDDATGQIIADGGLVGIFNGARIVNGVLTTPNDGVFYTTNSATLTDVTNEGTYNLISGAAVTVDGEGITNNGTITVNSNNAGATTILLFDGDGMLEGTGEIILNRISTNSQMATAEGTTVTQAATHAIRGSGWLSASLVNNGVIESGSGATTNALRLLTNDKINNHIIRAASGVAVEIEGILVTQDKSNGRIIADESEVVIFGGAQIDGGRLESVGAGSIRTSGAATLTDVTNEGIYNVFAGSTLTIGGAGLTNNGTMTINSNNGGALTTLQVNDIAMLEGTGEIVLNRLATNARINIANGAKLTQAADHTIRGIGQINGFVESAGRLEGNSGTQLLELNGYVMGNGTLQDVRIDGVHSPGAGVGTVNAKGVYTHSSSSRLIVEVGGNVAGTLHDQLVSSGTVNLDGQLHVRSVDAGNGDYVPTIGEQLTIIISTNPIVGTFDNSSASSIAGLNLIDWNVLYDTNEVLLEAIAITALQEGDYNGDGVINVADYVRWRDSMSNDMAGYDAWRANFGATNGSGAGNAAVPEPSAWGLILAAFLWQLVSRFRWR